MIARVFVRIAERARVATRLIWIVLLALCIPAAGALAGRATGSYGRSPQEGSGDSSGQVSRPVVGEAAPEIGPHVDWLRGGLRSTYEPGRVYLIDFWATWCLSCVARMPHLSTLAQQHAEEGLEVLGIAVLQRGGMSPSDFMKMRPTAMQYAVGRERLHGAVPELFQSTAERDSVPFLVIVDRHGRIAWRSNPGDPYGGLETALSRVLRGTWDAQKARAIDVEREQAERAGQPILRAYQEALGAREFGYAAQLLDQLLALHADLFGARIADLFNRHVDLDRATAFDTLALRLHAIARNPPALLAVARSIATVFPLEAAERRLALDLASAAADLKAGLDPDYDWALAKLEAQLGEPGAAATTMDRALASAARQNWAPAVLDMMRREASSYRKRR